VMKIFPSLVMHNVTPERNLEVYTMDYSGFGVIAIKGIQEIKYDLDTKDAKIADQQKRIEALETAVKNFETALSQCCTNYTSKAHNTVVTNDAARLEQNTPNPFSQETFIHYYLPANSIAVLKVMSLEGQEILTQQITAAGYGEVRISGST